MYKSLYSKGDLRAHETEENKEEKKENQPVPESSSSKSLLTYIFIGVVAEARIAHGFFTSITGPTLPSLAFNCDVSVGDVSSVFAWRGLGNVVGAIAAGIILPRLSSGKVKLLTIGGTLLVNGLFIAVIPLLTELWLLGTVAFATTLTSSYFTTGLESLVLNIFGAEGSAWVVAIYHAFFTIGGFLAPLLVQVFKSSDPLKECVTNADNFTGYDKNYTSGNHFDLIDEDILPPYLIVGVIVLASGIFTCVCAVWKLIEKLTTAKHDEVDMRGEDPWRKLLVFFMFTMFIHACSANTDTIFQSYIYYYALCSKAFDWDPVKANYLNMIFWAALTAGRFIGTYTTRKIRPTFLLLIYFIGSTIGISLILGVDGNIGGSSNDAILYTATVLFGVFCALFYGSSTSLCNSFTNLGLTYVFINNLGASVGTMIAPTITGKHIEDSPISFAWACLVFCLGVLFFELFVHLEGFRIMDRISYSTSLKAFLHCSFPVEGFGETAQIRPESTESVIKKDSSLF
ncbi:Oidioi.mRNA.OKI2018_I69.chr1.g3819.t1.cds [Oikopleura dioica]|uniref:Oidioi.mRNA.OKI2018_I69.chr1.g3819.t1.cds n=1 Tax=Oikopleura dioica TaxID=34765 RepID=A0ABN7T253_OIKDI|nr:Oidioi.mRNA.OKI2018_I69.chr1.g3819.t1.cds [Oikopleura dioica]